jgi:hypothetical protein
MNNNSVYLFIYVLTQLERKLKRITSKDENKHKERRKDKAIIIIIIMYKIQTEPVAKSPVGRPKHRRGSNT